MRIFALFAILLFPLVVSSQEDSKRIDFSDVNHNSNASSIISNSSSNSLIDSVYSYNKDSVKQKRTTIFTNDAGKCYINFSTGIVAGKYNKLVYLAADFGINLGYFVYLDVGLIAHGIFSLDLHINPSLGINLFKKKIFVFAGAGWYNSIAVGSGYNVILRLYYNLSKNVSLGLDSRYARYNDPINQKIDLNSLGLTLSLGL
jgi:hypothetical protein